MVFRSTNMANEQQQLHKYTLPPPSSIKLSEEELLRLGPHELVKRLQKVENDSLKLMVDHGSMMKEVNCRMQVHLMEIRGLKEVNQRLQDDNQELRDLCCFLDDDRQKGRKLAREWQRFGRYTASVMRQEVSAYQSKLCELEGKQQELIKDNIELKELCLYLDEERNISHSALCSQCGALVHNHGPRDEGDGSSTSTNNDELGLPLQIPPPPPTRSSSRERLLEESIQRQRSIINEQILQYIRSLEQRIRQLEDKQKMEAESSQSPTKPEAVVHAMKVLEVHEELEKPLFTEFEEVGQGEKALVREMCNVVWRKLEEGPITSHW